MHWVSNFPLFTSTEYNSASGQIQLALRIIILQENKFILQPVCVSGTNSSITTTNRLLLRDMEKLASAIGRYYERLIIDELSEFDGEIAIVWDRALIRRLNTFVSMKALSERGVVKSFPLENAVSSDIPHLLYIVSPTIASVQLLLSNYLEKLPEHDMRVHRVIFVPECPSPLEETLKSNTRIWSRISPVRNLRIQWLPSEQPDSLHLALPELPIRMLVDGNWNYLYKCSIALCQLIGRATTLPPTFYYKGAWSKQVVEIIKRLWSQNGSPHEACLELNPGVDKVILIDRWLDPLTPLLTQFTYGGAIDDIFGIDVQGRVKGVDSHAKEEGDKEKLKELNLNDPIYTRLEAEHVNAIGALLKNVIGEVKDEEEQRKQLASLAEFKSYIATVAPKVVTKKKSLDTFMELATIVQARQADDLYIDTVRCEQEILANMHLEKPIPLVESIIVEGKNPTTALRLIALQSLMNRGLKASTYHLYRRLFLQSYGICELERWLRLQIAGLIRNGEEGRVEMSYPPMDYQSSAKRYQLEAPEVDEIRRSDSAYAYNGRASLLVRHLEEGIKSAWVEFTRTACTDVPTRAQAPAAEAMRNGRAQSTPQSQTGSGRTIVFIIGGVTRSEISALRLTFKETSILSTALLNSHSLLESFKLNN